MYAKIRKYYSQLERTLASKEKWLIVNNLGHLDAPHNC